jgi:hypothetical protein
MLHMSDMGFGCCCSLYLNAAVNQFAITLGNELFTMQLITNLLVILRMAEFGLVEYFDIGDALRIIGTYFWYFIIQGSKCKNFQLTLKQKF